MLLDRLIDALKIEGKQNGIEFGDKLAQLVIKANPKTAKAEVGVMIDILNAFYEGKFRFKEHPWSTRQLGGFTQQLAPIELVPVH
jgi:hypothetical protein